MKKKVLFILPFCRPSGVGSSLSSVYNYLDKNKYNLFVYSIREGFKEEIQCLPYSNRLISSNKLLSYYFGNYRSAPFQIKSRVIILKMIARLSYSTRLFIESLVEKHVVRKLEAKHQFDTVIGFMEGPSTNMASFFKATNKVAWIHCNYNTCVPPNISEESMYSRFKTIVCVSNYTAEVFKERYRSVADNVLSIYNPQDTERILSKSLEVIDDEAFNNNVFTIISIGRINHIKRFRLIPIIAAQIKQNRTDFNWYIIGGEQEKEELEGMRNGIIENGVADCVHWLNYKSNPYPYMRASHLLVSTSLSEACPMIFNEARTLDVPIVSADFPTSYEFIENGIDGVISNIDTMADNILKMMGDKVFYQAIKEQSKKVIIDTQSIMNSIENII